MADLSEAIAAFWCLFLERASDLAVAESAEEPVYDELLAKLQEVDPGLYLEFSSHPRECELIVTADGKAALFPLARAVVAAAPAVETWQIRALKPRIGLPETVDWEGLTLRTDGIVFDALERKGSDDLRLRIFVPGIGAKDVENAHGAVLRALDDVLGEEKFAHSVQSTEVCPLPAGATRDDHIPIEDLEEFIEWRDRRRKGAG
jgi:hypothetical protein